MEMPTGLIVILILMLQSHCLSIPSSGMYSIISARVIALVNLRWRANLFKASSIWTSVSSSSLLVLPFTISITVAGRIFASEKYSFISIDSSYTYSEIMIAIMLNNKGKNIPARGRDIRCSGLFCE